MSENNIKKLLRSLAGSAQDVENALQQFYTGFSIDAAVGAQLNILGKIVGQDRNGMDDDHYRRAIRARISVNRSKGTIRDILRVADLIVYDDNATLQIDNQGAAAVVLRVIGDPLPDDTADLLIRMLEDTKSGGVRLILEWSPLPVTDWLQLDVGHLDQKKFLGAVD
jgi:hypothetical protein